MLPQSSVQRDEKGVGRPRATHTDELADYAPGGYGDDAEHDDAGSADLIADPSHIWGTSRAR